MQFGNRIGIVAAACFIVIAISLPVAGAEPVAVKHPVLKHDLDPVTLKKGAASGNVLLNKPEAELAALVPRQTPFITCDCPSCGAQTYTRGPDKVLWQFEFPDQLTCRTCQTKYPNDRFPTNHTAKFFNPRGESIEVPCYLDAAGKPFFLPSTIDSWRNAALTAGIDALAKSYATSKNEDHARRVAVLLAAYAESFPHYLVKDFRTSIDDPPGVRGAQRSWYEFVSTGGPWLVNGKPRGAKPSEPAASEVQTSTPYGWTQSRWGWGRWASEVPEELLKAYDLVYHSAAFEQLSTERGRDVRKQIEDDLFRNAADFVVSYPFWYHIHNNAGSQVAAVVRTGMVVNEPRYLAHGQRWARSVLEQYAFSRDAAFGESPGYFYVFFETNGGNFHAVKEAAALQTDAAAQATIASAQKSIAFLDRSIAAIESMRFPNGSALPISDNRHDDFADPTVRVGGGRSPALTSSTNVLLPGYGHAVLGAGSGDRQIQAHLHFSPFKEAIHTHPDGLSLMLFAFGAEMYTDIGYNRSKYRPWASTTLSHNTVVVDRAPQHGESTKGRLLVSASDPRGWSFVQVEDSGAYGAPVTRYRRSLLLNATDVEAPYLVDVFEVRGGQMHDYALHGPTVFDSTATTDLPLVPLSGERPLLTSDEAANFDLAAHPYGLFTNVRAATPIENFLVDFRLIEPFQLPEYVANPRYPTGSSFHYAVDPANYADRGALGVQSRFVGLHEQAGQSWHVKLGETPSLLRGGLVGTPLTERLRRPSLLVRHEGSSPLSSVFIAVHEPYYRKPNITAIRSLKTVESQANATAVEIVMADRVDTVLLTLDGEGTNLSAPATASLRGKLAVVERKRGAPPAGWLVGGTSFQQGDFTLQNDSAAYTGTIEAVSSVWNGAAENSFTTSSDLPEGNTLHGRWMIVHHGDGAADEGYQIDRIERRNHQSIIHLTDEPGLRIDGATTEEIFLPRRRWTGPNRFTVLTQTSSS